MAKPEGIPKSLFTGVQTVADSSTFDFVTTTGENLKILKSDLLAALGVGGTLEQEGDNLATPVLDIQGTFNLIRNLENGSGVKASVSPQNGILLDHNFTFNSIGAALSGNPTDTSPVLKSLVNGTGISIVQGTNTLTINSTGVTAATNTIVINEESDFPIQDATTITLSAGIRYVIGASFSTAKGFICEPGFVLTAGNQFGPELTYTGTGDMFTSTLAGGIIEDIQLDSPNANQTFNMSDTSLTEIFIIRNVLVNNTPKWGTYNGFITMIINSSSSGNADAGLTILGTGQLVLSLSEFALVSTSGSIVQLDLGSAVIANLELNNLILVAPGGFQVSGLANNGNVPADSIAMLTNSSVAAGAVQLENISGDDFRWEFISNTGVADTRPDGLASIIDNATETVIAAPSTDGTNAVLVAGTWTVEGSSHFTVDTAGRITYNGERPFRAPIDATVNVLMASGSTKNVSAYLAINGVVVRATEGKSTPTSSLGDSSICQWQHTFLTGHFVETFLENQSDAVNIIGVSGVIRVN